MAYRKRMSKNTEQGRDKDEKQKGGTRVKQKSKTQPRRQSKLTLFFFVTAVVLFSICILYFVIHGRISTTGEESTREGGEYTSDIPARTSTSRKELKTSSSLQGSPPSQSNVSWHSLCIVKFQYTCLCRKLHTLTYVWMCVCASTTL